MTPKIRSKSNVIIEGNIEIEICSTTRVEPKTVVELYSDPQTSPLLPKKDKNDPQNEAKFKCQNLGNHRR